MWRYKLKRSPGTLCRVSSWSLWRARRGCVISHKYAETLCVFLLKVLDQYTLKLSSHHLAGQISHSPKNHYRLFYGPKSFIMVQLHKRTLYDGEH